MLQFGLWVNYAPEFGATSTKIFVDTTNIFVVQFFP
jgi:hypothetical protein